jgi:hypothetical protein
MYLKLGCHLPSRFAFPRGLLECRTRSMPCFASMLTNCRDRQFATTPAGRWPSCEQLRQTSEMEIVF